MCGSGVAVMFEALDRTGSMKQAGMSKIYRAFHISAERNNMKVFKNVYKKINKYDVFVLKPHSLFGFRQNAVTSGLGGTAQSSSAVD